MTANMYRVGDYVYFETSSTAPYQIRRIEELIKTPNGNVEAKVMCFFRRRDIATSLVMMADKQRHENMDATLISALEEEQEREAEQLAEKERHQLKHRELFLSRQVETLPATHIRGKCSVTLLNETESLLYYLNKEDCFFYSLVFDPHQKTLLADKGEIRVGPQYQAEIPPLLPKAGDDTRKMEDLEELVYTPSHNLTDRQIDQFLIICRSVGTFARALDCSSSVKQPSLHMSAAAASRDITLFHAMDILHKHNYNITSAISSLVPSGGPVLCRDEMEEWSASEANLFEEALEKYGKDFIDVRQDFLPWKSLKNVIEYYYMWKTTDRYVQQKRVKAVEAESKLKQVYIPNYNNKPGVLNGASAGESPSASGRPCESCYTPTSSQWYAFGPAHLQCRLCQSCWNYFKRYGGLKYPTRLEQVDLISGSGSDRIPPHVASHRPHRCTISGCGKEFKLKAHLARHCATAHGLVIRAGSPRPIMKTRAAFYLHTTPATRKARRYACQQLVRVRHAARNPFQPINFMAIKQEYHSRIVEGQPDLPKLQKTFYELGMGGASGAEWVETRRIALRVMKEIGSYTARVEELVQKEVCEVVQQIIKHGEHPIRIREFLCESSANTITTLILGERLMHDNSVAKDVMKAIDAIIEYTPTTGMMNFSPMLSKILQFMGLEKKFLLVEKVKKFRELVSNTIDERTENCEIKNENSFISRYYEEIENEKNKPSYISVYSLKGAIPSLLVGVETSRTTIVWSLVAMAEHPDIQQKVHEELDRVVGKDGSILWADRFKIPYTYATLMECMRYTTEIPLSSMRMASEDMHIQGYLIPKGTFLTVNIWAIHNDPKYWDKPDQFMPERFLLDDGKKVNTAPESFCPFSLGKRMCPGKLISFMENLQYFTIIMQNFKILPKAGDKVKYGMHLGLSYQATNVELRFVRR